MTEKDHFNELNNKVTYLKNILFNIPGCVFWKDVSGTYQGCNRVFLEMVGLDSEKEVIGKTDNDFSWRNQASDLRKNDLLIIESGQTKIFEEEVCLANGEKKLYSVVKTPLFDSGGKNIIGVLGTSVDINRNLVLKHILVNLPGHVYWKDKTGVYLGCNDRQANSLGLDFGKQVLGKTDFELPWGRETAEKFRENDLEVIKTGTPLVIEEPAIANGHPATVLSQKVPLRNTSGNIMGVLGISVDITRLKETQADLQIALEQAKASDKAKTEFLENMRHDIRTPLSGIIGCAQLIQMQSDNPKKVSEFSDYLVQSSDALLAFLNKILESMTVASGEIPLLKKKFNLKEALEEIVRLNKSQTVAKDLRLSLDYDEAIPSYLMGDPVRTQRIILELLTNALKYTAKGSIKISARLMKDKKREVIIELRVSDTGMGIPRDKHNEVYTRFKRLTPSYEGIYQGQGLGLSVAKQFIEDLSGEIHLESDVGKGATFICLIPFQKSLLTVEPTHAEESKEFQENSISPTKKVINEPSASEVAVSHGGRILIAEDNPIVCRVLKNLLEERGYEVTATVDGKATLEALKNGIFAFALLDIGLPELKGTEACKRYRDWEKETNKPRLPIFALSGHAVEEAEKECNESGIDRSFTKPLTSKIMLKIESFIKP